MPTIFARIDDSLAGSDLPARLAAQGENLSSVATTIANLINNPPESLGDLERAINELPLPDLEIGGEFAATLDSIRASVPVDLTSVTGELEAGLQSLGTTIDGEITGPLREVIEAALAVYQLINTDLTCSDVDGTSASPGGGETDGATPENGTDTEGPTGVGTPTGLEAATAQVDALSALLDAAPSPLDVEGLLAWLHDATAILSHDGPVSFPLPLLDDLIDPLQTLQAWRAMQPDDIRAHMVLSIQDLSAFIRDSVGGLLGTLAAELAATVAHLHTDTLAEIADSLTTRLAELRAAVNSGDLGDTDGAISEINTRLDQYETLRATLQADLLADLPDLNRRLAALPQDLADRMDHLLSVLRPSQSLAFLESIVSATETSDSATEEVEAALRPLVTWIEDLTEQLDLTAIREPLVTVAETARGSVDGLEQGLAGVTLEVRAIFEQVETLLDQVDTQALAEQVEVEIQNFAQQLNQELLALFQPARDGVVQVLQSIGDSLDGFDPEEVIDALRQAIDALAGVLEDPEVASALKQIRDALDAATALLDQLSFAPLTDQVISAIEEVAAALQTIDASQLNPILQAALQAALAVLPSDLTPITDPFIDEFDELVETGPVPLLERVREQPQRLLDRVRGFEPSVLVGGALTEPYRELLSRMEQFEPSRLLDPVETELEHLKERLRTDANPGAPIQLLEQPFAQLTQAFDRLSPDDLVQPLEQAITGAIDGVLDALPVDEVFDQIDAAVGAVEAVSTFAERLATLLEKLRDLLQGLVGSREQIESWIDSALDKVEAIGDADSLQPSFVDLSAALDETRAENLLDQYDDAAAPLQSALATLNPQTRLAALAQVHATFPRSALAALPDSPEKAALDTALARFDPLEPDFGAPYQALAAYQQSLAQAQSVLQSVMTDWDARYHGADGLLMSLRVTGATPTELRQLIHEALEPQFIRPVHALFAGIEPLSGPVEALLSTIQGLVASLQEKLSDVLSGPESLGAIREALQELVERLRNFNLDFLRTSLEDVFAEVRAKLEAVDPARLREVVETAFDATLDTITMSQIFPPDEVAALDEDYAQLVDQLRALDPETLVVEVIQPEFEERLDSLVDTFDLTPLLTALVELLRSLDRELRDEMERVNQAYQDMRRAVPSIGAGAGLGF
jgi:tetratricopeptide (TPR) repeat protein